MKILSQKRIVLRLALLASSAALFTATAIARLNSPDPVASLSR